MGADDGTRTGVTRRDFLRQASLAVVAGLSGMRMAVAAKGRPFAADDPLATVVLVRDRNALRGDDTVDGGVVNTMIRDGVKALTDNATAADAWRALLRPEDTVGLKFSRCGWMRVPTRQEVIDAVAEGLQQVPIPEERVRSADYGLKPEECTALINISSLKAHPLTGIAGAIKNYINFHPSPEDFHDERRVKLPDVWLRPEVKGKTRLVVLDLITPYFGTGPQIDPRYQGDYRGVLLASDPVAADTVALALCQKMRDRHRGKPWPINPPPLFLQKADGEYKLGTADPNRIRLIRLGWEEGVLV